MKDYSGSVFNGCVFVREMPSVTSAGGNKRRIATWRCSCGEMFTAAIGNVTSGQVKSCGCKKVASTVARSTKHGHSAASGATKLYRFWQSMKDRCLNPDSTNYKNYGGRGIMMHDPWQHSFDTFQAWFNRHFGLDDVPPNLSMDRRNNDGNYEPSNLRLASLIEQANNRRNNHVVTYLGQNFTVTELARKVGIKPATLHARLGKGITVEKAIL